MTIETLHEKTQYRLCDCIAELNDVDDQIDKLERGQQTVARRLQIKRYRVMIRIVNLEQRLGYLNCAEVMVCLKRWRR